MKVVVTGGCGFIGSNLVKRLLGEGHDVVVIDNFSGGRKDLLARHSTNPRLDVIEADISKEGSWQDHFESSDWCYHLAAPIDIRESRERPAKYFNSIMVGTFHVLESARSHNLKKLLYVNSAACYGIAEFYPTPEDAPKNPQYPYALFKWLAEEMFIYWANYYSVPSVGVRLFNLYGKGAGALFGKFVELKSFGLPLTITGDGSQRRDFTHIDDVIDALQMVCIKGRIGQVYNVGSGGTMTINEIASLFDSETNFIPRQAQEMDVTFGDITKIKDELGWQPRYSGAHGVASVLSAVFSDDEDNG